MMGREGRRKQWQGEASSSPLRCDWRMVDLGGLKCRLMVTVMKQGDFLALLLQFACLKDDMVL